MINVSRHSLLSVSTAYHSCIGDSASDEQYQESVYSSYSGEHEKSHVEPEPITKEHYEQLRRSLANPSRLEPPNFRSDARERLARLSRVQFLEFAMDVHDEVARITGSKNDQEAVPSSASRTDLSPHRIEARKKIAHLRGDLLQDLMSDIFYELGRRYPKFNEARDSFEPETSTQPEDQSSFSKLPGVRTPLAQIDMNQNLSDLVMGGIMKKVADDLNARHVDTISGTMSVSEIITILGQHGCPNITAVLDLKQCGTIPIAAGGFGDIYQGRLRGGTEVAIKCPRFFVNKSELTRADLKAAARELHTWSKYNHPNVVRLLGVALFRDRIAMVSLWMKHGTMSQYISRTPDVDRLRLCREIANGVAYLHDMGTVHGDIKGINIMLNVLISDDGTAKLIDFGNSRLKNSTLSFTGSQTTSSFSTRWTAPELLADGGPHTPEADVYALGMTILEIITGQVPFPEIKVEPAVITRVIIQKQHPQRPLDSIPSNKHGDALWAILVRCWSQNPLDRPLASEVASRIGKIKLVGLHSTAHPDEFGRLVSPGLARRFSWELGTRAQALLELDSPSISVFTAASIPGSPAASHSGSLDALVPVANAVKIALADGQLKDIMKITTDIVSSKPDGSLPLMKDGSAADPASNGVAVLVANWTESQGPDFAAAASDQITWLLQHVPRSSKGAISHRNNVMQFWSDFIYMVPPFLAYYGASTSNKTLIAESYRQIKLYREALLDDSGLWQHIRQGSFEDKGLWSTGNGWAAMGMMRVAATIKAGGYMDEFKDEFNDLADWTGGIFDAMWPLLTEDNLFYNYANNPKTFLDGASSALMAASVYRAAVLFNNTAHINSAEKVYNAIGGADALLPTSSSAIVSPTFTSTDSESPTSTPSKRRSHSRRATHHRVPLGVAHHSNDKSHHKRATKHIDSQGWLTPVVDPHSFHQIGQESAEGQAFVVMMYAARNDYLSKKGLQLHVGTGSVGPVANVVGVGIVAGSPGTAGSSGGGLNGPINVGGAGPNNNTTSSGTTKNNGAGTVRVATGALVGMAGLLLALLI